MTRAALESCVGGALFPGIEASWFLRSTYPYSEPFRLDPANLAAGDVTKQMSVPWQADFYDCTMAPGGDSSLAWWPAQRPDEVFPEAGGAQVPWIRDIVASGQDMVDNWHKLGFVVARGAKLVETERSKVCRSLSFIVDKGEYFEDDVAALLNMGSPARFVAAIHVLADGFVPSDLGITRRDPSPAELVALAPTVTFARSDGTAVASMTAIVEALLLQDPSLPAGQGQRCTFTYAVAFSGTDAFSAGSSPVELQTVAANATKALPGATFTASVDLQLSNRANPFMLATDLRVFQAAEGETVHGVTMGTNASTFVSDLLTAFNAAPAANHPFDTLASDPAASPLELSDTVAGKTVFNFAVARVRYRGHSNANDIRLFFRLFTTAASGLNYDVATTYRRGLPRTAPVALLGLQAGGLVTIPCFGGARVDSSTTALIRQTDEVNHKTLGAAFGGEVHAYFGCWLDFNQVSPQFPSHPAPPDGPWPSQRRSIQQLMRGLQPSLVSEIYYPTDLIPAGATPSSNAKLCHVNLVLHDSGVPPTPGPLVTHHTFEIQASPPARRGSPTGAAPDAEELVFRWGSLPGGSLITLYVPGIDADQILRLAGQLHESSTLKRIDAHSIGCRPAHITYIPLPAGRMKNAQALLTVTMPPPGPQPTPVKVTVSQIAGQPRRTLGTFQVVIPPGGASGQPGAPANPTPLLSHLATNIAVDDPWHAIFNRLDPGTTVAVHPEPKSPMAIHPEPNTPVAVHPEPTSTT